MSQWRFTGAIVSALILGGAFSSGAVARNSSNVGGPDDVEITADVEGAIAQHRELGAPNQIYVDTPRPRGLPIGRGLQLSDS